MSRLTRGFLCLFIITSLGAKTGAQGAENLFENNLTSPAGQIEEGIPSGWTVTKPVPDMAPSDYAFTEDQDHKQENGAPFTRLTINDKSGVIVLRSHEIPISEAGDYRFSIKLDNDFNASVGISFQRIPADPESQIVISEAPAGIGVYDNKMSAEIQNKSFPAGTYNEMVIYLTVPAGVSAMTVGLHCHRNPEVGGNTLGFGDVKLEVEKE